MMKQSMMCLVLVACAPRAPATRTLRTVVADDAAPLLEAWAAAAGGRERLAGIQVVRTTGKIEAGGLTGTFTAWETARGERRQEEELGQVDRSVDVFDGARGWQVDRNRKVRALDGPELEHQISLAYLGAHAALLLDRRPGRIAREGDTLRLEPQGGRPLTVALDPATHLPATISRRDAEKTRVLTFSDWREVSGVRFPFTIRDEDGDPRDTKVFRVDAVAIERAAPAGAFARPADPPPDFRFAAGGKASMPIEIVSSLVFVQTGVNGSAPLAFIVDTGAEVTVINRSRLARLGLQAVGDLSVGAGGGNVEMSYVKDVSFGLPGVTLTGQTVTAIPLDALEGPLGHPIDGILGYDFLSRFVVELDYARSTLTLHDPASGHKPAGEMVPLTLEDSVPSLRATIDIPGRPPVVGRFVVDTGCNCEASFSAPFTQAHRLIEASPKILTPPRGSSRGAGGETDTVVGRIAGMTIGGIKLPSLAVSFGRDTVGAMADPESAGVIGGKLLRRFAVTFDYGRKSMWLVKSPGFDQPSKVVGAGIQWAPEGGGFVVRALVDGSPGAEVGLAAGDVLVSVDGKAAAGHTMGTLDELFHQEGTPHLVVVKRGGRQVKVTVTPRELI